MIDIKAWYIILWFNPPYSVNVKTHMGKKFLELLDKHFPSGHPLLNRNTVKVSYKCLPNMKSILTKNSSKVLNLQSGQEDQTFGCNCRIKAECPLPGQSKTPALIYKATVETVTRKETYVGLSAPPFKNRMYGHKWSFTHEDRRKETTLSKYIFGSSKTKTYLSPILGKLFPGLIHSPKWQGCANCV